MSVLPSMGIFLYFYGFCITSTVVRNGVNFYGSLEQQESLLFAAFCGYYILEIMSVGVEMKVYDSVQSSTLVYIPRDKDAPSLLWRTFYATEIYLHMSTIVLRNMIFFVRIFPRFFNDGY